MPIGGVVGLIIQNGGDIDEDINQRIKGWWQKWRNALWCCAIRGFHLG